jgi:hypothetical protein
MIDALPLLLGPEGYQISRSVRLRSSASAYFNRTPASAGNRKTWTWSGWVKRGLGSTADDRILFSGTTNGTSTIGALFFNGGGESLRYIDLTSPSTFQTNVTVTPVYRDFSAWYHIVLLVDTTQATAANRIRFFVNSVEVTAFTTTVYPSQNADTFVNAAQQHRIGTYPYSATGPFDGYLTEINFIDGQALTPSSFGETNLVTGVWQPKRYTGTYGTNGFYLNFSDPSAATAAAIGKDNSGNGNNWTPNNISVTAGVTYDSMLDVPTPWPDGGNGRGNYAVLNPLQASAPTLSAGNLTTPSLSAQTVYGTVSVNSGKWYWEGKCTARATGTTYVGVENSTYGLSNQAWSTSVFAMQNNSQKYLAGAVTSYGSGFAAGDTVGIAVDVTADTLEFFVNGTSYGQITSAGMAQGNMRPMFQGNTATWEVNFGQRPFAYTPPSGFRALNTLNLPTPTILKGNQFFDATIYTGTAATQNVVNAGAFQPDLVWTKRRSVANSHQIFDSIRGVTAKLSSDTTAAETSAEGQLTSFNTNGFTVPNNAYVNSSPDAFVAWQWKEGATQGFDIVTYTGTGSNTTIAHNLGVAPRMMIVKRRSGASDWIVWHSTFAGTEYIALNTTAAKVTGATIWNSTSPTSSVFSVGTSGATNGNTDTYVAYLFAEVAGFSRFGSFTGNGSTNGPFVFCGFRPRYFMWKRTDGAGSDWVVYDTARSPTNFAFGALYPNGSLAQDSADFGDFLSNGVKLRQTVYNVSGGTYIFAAFAENPQKFALAR